MHFSDAYLAICRNILGHVINYRTSGNNAQYITGYNIKTSDMSYNIGKIYTI